MRIFYENVFADYINFFIQKLFYTKYQLQKKVQPNFKYRKKEKI